MEVSFTLLFVVFVVVMFLASSIKVLNEYERAVIFRLGRIIDTKGPGLIILIPVVDKMVKVDMRTITMDVPPQDVITKDNVSIKVNAASISVSWIPMPPLRWWRTICTQPPSWRKRPSAVSAVRSNWMRSSRNGKRSI